MMGTSLHTLVQMVDNGLGLTFVPDMAVGAGILDGTSIRLARLEAGAWLAADRARLAPGQPARGRISVAGRCLARHPRRDDQPIPGVARAKLTNRRG